MERVMRHGRQSKATWKLGCELVGPKHHTHL
jgi:hypothetical protein